MPLDRPRPDPLTALLRALAASGDSLIASWAQAMLAHGEQAASDGHPATNPDDTAARAAAEK
jgi:hypothetical protein